jgi:CobQ-like glutamine amidotransferase family enzyme
VAGGGNNGEDGLEGCRAGRIVGTYVHGPLLPKNGWLADAVLSWARDRRGLAWVLAPLDDGLEALAAQRAAGIARAERR